MRATLEQNAREHAARERAANERAASERAAKERAANERAASERAAKERAALVGRVVFKEFEGCGLFRGRVHSFDRVTGFRIVYEDGDREDVSEATLVHAGPYRSALLALCAACMAGRPPR